VLEDHPPPLIAHTVHSIQYTVYYNVVHNDLFMLTFEIVKVTQVSKPHPWHTHDKQTNKHMANEMNAMNEHRAKQSKANNSSKELQLQSQLQPRTVAHDLGAVGGPDALLGGAQALVALLVARQRVLVQPVHLRARERDEG
jgi:hypothetical protein